MPRLNVIGMVPILELREAERRPVRGPALVTLAILALNVWVFLQQVALATMHPRLLRMLIHDYALIPRLAVASPDHGLVSAVTSLFLHGDWTHLLGNLWFLWIFGPSVERALGSVRFAAFYLLGGLCAGLAQVLIDPLSPIPTLGASGAIGAVLAGYVSLFPLRRILSWVVFFVLPIPALVFVGEWFVFNLLSGVDGLVAMEMGEHSVGVAWWAHVGGFLGGLILVRLLYPQSPRSHRRLSHDEVWVVSDEGAEAHRVIYRA